MVGSLNVPAHVPAVLVGSRLASVAARCRAELDDLVRLHTRPLVGRRRPNLPK